METINKNDFIDVYVLKTLNEIKDTVQKKIILDKGREEEIDKKMSMVLKDLINSNFKNLQTDPKGNLIYTFLPIVDEKENKKVRLSLVLYYAALYYDNVDLLHELLKENVDFEVNGYSINLQYLDKSISSNFDRRQYIKMIKTCGDIFANFAQSIQYLSEKEKEQYIERFSKIIVDKYEQICNEIKENPYHRLSFNCTFTKTCLDIFTDETYKQATSKQLEMINLCNMKKCSEETCQRLNNLMITKGFSKYLYNYDLMMQLYTDEQLEILPSDISYAISNFSNSEASLNKIIDFIQRRPDLARSIVCISKERFMKIDNFTLIEIFNSRSRHYNDDTIDKIMRKKSAIKRLFGAYKKIDTQEQKEPVLVKKKLHQKNN